MGLKLRFAALAHAKGYRRELYDLENALWHSFELSLQILFQLESWFCMTANC
jgi:hypothetical protein